MMRKPKDQCTLSEYQFYWCEGAGHREAGTAMLPYTVCAGCAAEWYGMHAAPFDRRCANALADEVAVLVRRAVIDSRSPAADALLDYRNPPSTPRADRLAQVEDALRTGREAIGVMVEIIIQCFLETSDSALDKDTATKVLARIRAAKPIMDAALGRPR